MDKNAVLERLVAYTDQLLANSTPEAPEWNIEVKLTGRKNNWNYIDGCMISAVLDLYEVTGKQAYLDFAREYEGFFVQEDGSITTYEAETYDADAIRSGANLFRLYDYTGEERFRKGMDTLRAQLDTHPRTPEGNFWHREALYEQVWMDGLYMIQPFYAEYEKRYNEGKGFEDTVAQFKSVAEIMRDKETGLYYHGYDASRGMFWADKETGLSSSFWLRAMCWYFVGLVDCAGVLRDVRPDLYEELRAIFVDLAESLKRFQHESGMWYQVPNCPGLEGNYLETSGTMLIAAGILRAVRYGMLDESWREVAEKAFYGTADRYLKLHDDGTITLGGICIMGALGELPTQDGSVEYYLSEPVVENESKGVAPMLYAAVELLRAQKEQA